LLVLSGCTNTDLGACDAVVVMVVVEVVVGVMVVVVVKRGDVVECVGEEMLFCVLCLVGGWIWI
jgi:hypothetical protein